MVRSGSRYLLIVASFLPTTIIIVRIINIHTYASRIKYLLWTPPVHIPARGNISIGRIYGGSSEPNEWYHHNHLLVSLSAPLRAPGSIIDRTDRLGLIYITLPHLMEHWRSCRFNNNKSMIIIIVSIDRCVSCIYGFTTPMTWMNGRTRRAGSTHIHTGTKYDSVEAKILRWEKIPGRFSFLRACPDDVFGQEKDAVW